MTIPSVVFETLWANPADGWSIAARAYARAMLMAGWDVRLKSPVQVFSDALTPEVRKFLPLERPLSSWDAYIFSSPLGGAEQMEHIFSALDQARRPVMLYTMFERTRIEPDLANRIANLDGCFVPSLTNAARLAKALKKFPPTWTAIPIPFFDDDARLSLPLPRNQPRVFGWQGRWEPRKAPDRLLRAFMRAFSPSEAELVLKIGPVEWKHSKFQTPEEVIADELHTDRYRKKGWTETNWPASIRIVRERLSLERMLSLEAGIDIYVSPSRGEGIDLPAFHARLAGRRLVLTESGGPEDFADEDDIVIRATTENAEAPEYAWLWGPGATLIDYPTSDLSGALIEARKRPIKKRSPPTAHTAENVKNHLSEWLERCRSRILGYPCIRAT